LNSEREINDFWQLTGITQMMLLVMMMSMDDDEYGPHMANPWNGRDLWPVPPLAPAAFAYLCLRGLFCGSGPRGRPGLPSDSRR
jgi:hypothetical protein